MVWYGTQKRHKNTHLPKEMSPVPVLSNSWKATMKSASGTHRTDSKAKNSWNEISLDVGGGGGRQRHAH